MSTRNESHSRYILLVEDDEIDREMVIRYLGKYASYIKIIATHDAIAALQILRGQAGHQPLGRPYFILLDLNLPRMSGLEFLHVLRQDPELKHDPVIVLTASSNEQDQARASAHNVLAYLRKETWASSYSQLIHWLESYRPGQVSSKFA